MTDYRVTFAAIVATKGRSDELGRLLISLRSQTYPVAEIIIVDQNNDDRVGRIVRRFGDLPIKLVSATAVVGVNASRNLGLNFCHSEFVFFPDDDCWYPIDTVERVNEYFKLSGYDVIVGRPTEEGTGRTINGRFLSKPQPVNRDSVWFTQIEWLSFFRSTAIIGVHGFDEAVGPGAGTPWGGHEIQDLSLRLIDNECKVFYDPSLTGHHAEVTLISDGRSGLLKGQAYARGHGYVLAKNGYPLKSAIYWSARPCFTAVRSIITGKPREASYAFSIAASRLSGYIRSKLLKRWTS